MATLSFAMDGINYSYTSSNTTQSAFARDTTYPSNREVFNINGYTYTATPPTNAAGILIQKLFGGSLTTGDYYPFHPTTIDSSKTNYGSFTFESDYNAITGKYKLWTSDSAFKITIVTKSSNKIEGTFLGTITNDTLTPKKRVVSNGIFSYTY